jgi:uncharacterized membrane protein (UPF0127 family)
MIVNENNGEIISKKEKYCASVLSQGLGLMFSPRKNLIMEFKKDKKISLHNFFVFYPLEILLLDKRGKVIEIKDEFRPFTFWNSKNPGRYLIELGEEDSKKKVSLGDILKIEK